MGFIKGKSAIHVARTYLGQRKNYTGMHFWARGYYTYRRLEQMKSQYESTYKNKNTKIIGWTNCHY